MCGLCKFSICKLSVERVIKLRSRAASICFAPRVRDSPRDEYQRDPPFDIDDFYTLHVSAYGAGLEEFNVEIRPRFATMLAVFSRQTPNERR